MDYNKLLLNKTALVTGASKGIGRACALTLAKAGAKVMVNYSSSEQDALSVVNEIKDFGGEAIAFKADISDASSVKEMFEVFEKSFNSTVDILVNNAGITKDGLLIRMSDDDFSKVVNTNLFGPFFCIKAAAKGMMKKKYGKIINVSSVVAFSGNAGQTNYVAAKAGLHGMTKSVALELGSRGVRVNSVAPGFIDTAMTDVLSDDIKKGIVDKVPLKKFGTVEDVAYAVLFLSTELSDYITGQVIHVNGGLYL